MFVNMTQPKTGLQKQVKIGFSWTTFFFGFWPALFRRDWKWTIIGLLVVVINVLTVKVFIGLLALVYAIVMAFLYNKIYVKGLIDDGYLPSTLADRQVLVGKGFATNTIQTADHVNDTQSQSNN